MCRVARTVYSQDARAALEELAAEEERNPALAAIEGEQRRRALEAAAAAGPPVVRVVIHIRPEPQQEAKPTGQGGPKPNVDYSKWRDLED